MQTHQPTTDLYRTVAMVADAAEDRWIALDDDDVIVDCGRGVKAGIAAAVGECLWDVYPGIENDLRRILEIARTEGTSQGVAYSAWLNMFLDARVRVVDLNRDSTLVVAYTAVAMGGLRACREMV